VGMAHDNHGGPALTVDSKGCLHIVYFPHHHPFRYRRSKRPNDASEWEDEAQFGQRCSYPTVLVGPDDTLYMTCRESRSGKPWVANLYTKPADGPWQGPVAILVADEPGYSHFQEALAWSPDRQTMHLSTRMYGGRPGRAHTVGYMRSRDCGRSWERADGSAIELPGTSQSISVIAANRSKRGRQFRCGSVAVGPEGMPHVLYSDASCRPAQAWIATPTDTGEWARQGLLEPVANALGQWSVGMPGGLAFAGDGRAHVVLTLQAYASVKAAGQGWGRAAQEVARLESTDRAHWSVAMCSRVDAKRPNWLPNIERPTGCNAVERPSLIYTSGTPGKTNKDILSNGVYWLSMDSIRG